MIVDSTEAEVRDTLERFLESVTKFLKERDPSRTSGPTADEIAGLLRCKGGGSVRY